MGIMMVTSSFEGYRDHVIHASLHDSSTVLLVMQLIQKVTITMTQKNQSLTPEQVTVFFRMAFGLLLVLSVSVDAIVEMDQHMLANILKDFSSTYHTAHEDKQTGTIVQTLLRRLTKSETAPTTETETINA
jgi:hypothetical protein